MATIRQGAGMNPEFEEDRSIYRQIAAGIEDDILQKLIGEESQVLSTNQLAAMYRISPATAAQGIRLLAQEGILYKKRGIGMFVSAGAVTKIRRKRRIAFYDRYVAPLLAEASRLGIDREELVGMLRSRKKA